MNFAAYIAEFIATRPAGATLAEIRAELRDPRLKGSLSAASRAGLVVCKGGKWHRTEKPIVSQVLREPDEIDERNMRVAADARFAALIGAQRYDDARVRPLPLRALRAEPNVTLIGCAARMCAQ